ncbi:hypothetical protein [Deinococcus cellulosilyticus]|uniref:Uncharacterized protein n=1 Tax=Deinococcus cellulosilyticus (strain DSM 18568 / NBRC 106333 / KACC 11606 / 5516J-15) TaxID=1223518 RepID=A0A511MZK5_DEIC1|nr:hypothetical protein [Deinococcus cellulosilyticus]GEM45989.1 hypothetical protein DC3_16240 [Deinococcus cellulosilyticus NBRC 106333 = KACC 11606]
MQGAATLSELYAGILRELPSAQKFSEQDAHLLKAHQDQLLGWSSDLEQAVLESISEDQNPFAGPGALFTVGHWWAEAIKNGTSQDFWHRLTMMGLVNANRRLRMASVVGAWGIVEQKLLEKTHASFSGPEATALAGALMRLVKTALALGSGSYLHGYLRALSESTGTSYALLERLAETELSNVISSM